MTNKIISRTRVQVLIEVEGSSYGEEWRLSDLIKQSSQEAILLMHNKLDKNGLTIIGQPKVISTSHFKE